jgi:uncharacterized membrane protein
MHLLGIPLRKPTHNELAAAVVMGIGLWLASLGLTQSVHVALNKFDAGALLLVCLWGCVSVRLGIRIDQGGRHVLASLTVSAVLLGCYEFMSRVLA